MTVDPRLRRNAVCTSVSSTQMPLHAIHDRATAWTHKYNASSERYFGGWISPHAIIGAFRVARSPELQSSTDVDPLPELSMKEAFDCRPACAGCWI